MKEEVSLILDEESPQELLKQIIRDTSIATEHLLLEASHLNLGTCWVAWFNQEEIRPLLGIPSDKYVIGIVTVGYADETPKPRTRKRLESMVHMRSGDFRGGCSPSIFNNQQFFIH